MCCIAMLYFSTCGFLCYIFLRVESCVVFSRALVFCIIFFSVWNCMLYFSSLIIVVQTSLYASSIITLKILALSNYVGDLELYFILLSLMYSYQEYTFHPNRGGHVVSRFQCDDLQISSYIINNLEGVPLQFLPKLRSHSLLPRLLPLNS